MASPGTDGVPGEAPNPPGEPLRVRHYFCFCQLSIRIDHVSLAGPAVALLRVFIIIIIFFRETA